MTRIVDLTDPTPPNGKDVHTPSSRAGWRRWLESNHDRPEGIWVVYRKKSSDLDGPVYDDLVDEAVCFGWIDSRLHRVDDDRVMQWFTPRRAGGIWSALNKERVDRLVRDGHMAAPGRAVIEQARADGSWSQTDEVDALVVPPDLDAALAGHPAARRAYDALSDSLKKRYLWWIHTAKRPTTRAKRINETVRQLAEG